MKILILGSEGVIGSSLCKHLHNHEITRWDIKLDPSHDLRISAPSMIEFDFIFFLAYDVGGSKYLVEQHLEFINNNVKLMFNVFEQLKLSKKPFIFASSQLQNIHVPYGTLKRLGSQYTELLNGITVKFWNVYGNEEIGLKSHVIPDIIQQYKTNGCIKLLTDGTEKKQFLHEDDCSKALIIVMNNFEEFKTKNKTEIDITSFKWSSILDIASIITNKIETTNIKGMFLECIEPDPFILNYWKPEISLETGILQLLNS